MSEPHRFGTVALAGPPNVGKSTLLNGLIGEKISIISRRPQTTRHRILGIKTLADAQVVLVDAPGLHGERSRGLNRAINRTAVNCMAEADLILFMIDASGWRPHWQQLFARVADKKTPTMLLINKIDRLRDRARLLPLMAHSMSLHPFQEIIPISALKTRDWGDFLQLISRALPLGEAGFPATQHTDRRARFFAAELVREQIFRLLGRELPYASAVEVTRFAATEHDPLLRIGVIIWVQKNSQKAIVIGRGGQQLKIIGERARRQMEKTYRRRVYLDVWVKARKGWAENAAMLRSLGYMEDAAR